jgi:uncharacterized protein (TIRG00374 family)
LMLLAGLLIIGTVFSLLMISEHTNGPLIRICGRFIGGPEAWNDAMRCYREQSKKLFVAYFLSVASVIFSVLLIHYMVLAVGSNPRVTESLIIGPLVILANTLPISPGGLGVAEGASAGLYSLVGQAGGANGMLLTRFFIVLFALLGLPFYVFSKKKIED